MRNFFFLAVLFLLSHSFYGQLDNSPFYSKDSLAGSKNDLFISLNSLAFQKNDEYYSSFANGQTFFGYNLNPEMEYYFSENVRLDVGLLAWKDFGNNQYSGIYPTYSLLVKHHSNEFIFGNIRANLNHKYIEPLFDFNRVIFSPVENGFQYLYHGKKLQGDLWVDWQRMIYPGSPFQEIIMGGLNLNYTLVENENMKLSLPFQYVLNHEGGQIDTVSKQLKLAGNGALGFEIQWKNTGWFDKISTKNYFTFWEDYFNHQGFQYKNGNGYYFNLAFTKKQHNIMLTYWHGNKYQGVLGAPVFMTESIAYSKNPLVKNIQSPRQLLFLRFISNFQLAEGVDFSLRFEPYYDFSKTFKQTFTNGIFDFSNGLYFSLNKKFFVARLKQKKE